MKRKGNPNEFNTPNSKDNTVFHQARYASSQEFERGLIANLVAKRAALLDAKEDRELIWFVQYLSLLTPGWRRGCSGRWF